MIFKQLTKLTPAEALLILDTSKCSFKSLLKSTLMDLFLKKVLKVIRVKKTSTSGKSRILAYIVVGENFYSYTPLPHEMIFLHSFKKRNNIRIQFRHVIKSAIEQSGGFKSYKRFFIMRTTTLRASLKDGFFVKMFNLIILNENGKVLQRNLKLEVSYLEKELAQLLNSNEKKATELVHRVNGHIFILNSIDIGIFLSLIHI